MDLQAFTGMNEATLLLRLVDLVLLVNLSELLWLVLRRPAGWAHRLPNACAGLSLALALRLGLAGAGLLWVAPCLMAAGLSHVLDLRVRRYTAGGWGPWASVSPSAATPRLPGHERTEP